MGLYDTTCTQCPWISIEKKCEKLKRIIEIILYVILSTNDLKKID